MGKTATPGTAIKAEDWAFTIAIITLNNTIKAIIQHFGYMHIFLLTSILSGV